MPLLNQFAIVALTLSIAIHVSATGRDLSGQLLEADNLMKAQDFGLAHAEYLRHAQDNPLAQFNLGLIEHYGWGRMPDPAAACRWFEGASAGKIPMAQQMLAECYRLGIHAPVSRTLAQQWYGRAAANGLPTANFLWGRMLIEDATGDEDQLNEGVRLCELAAEAGVIEAQIYLANAYRGGEIIAQDSRRALYWYRRAAQGNNAEAFYYLGSMMRDGELGEASHTATLQTLESAATLGHQQAYLPTAMLYFNAPVDPETQLPTAVNLAKSYLWLQAALRTSGSESETEKAGKMLEAVIEIMPQSWVADLDQQVDIHLEQYREYDQANASVD